METDGTMDQYNSRIAKIARWCGGGTRGYAITLGQTTYYTESEAYVLADPAWMAHENWHKVQWARDGIFKFAILYLWYSITKGYQNNPYEVEAREHE